MLLLWRAKLALSEDHAMHFAVGGFIGSHPNTKEVAEAQLFDIVGDIFVVLEVPIRVRRFIRAYTSLDIGLSKH